MATSIHEAPGPNAATQQPQTPAKATVWQRVRRFFNCAEAKRHSSSTHRRSGSMHTEHNSDGFGYDIPGEYDNLNEIAAPPPIQNQDEHAGLHVHHLLSLAGVDVVKAEVMGPHNTWVPNGYRDGNAQVDVTIQDSMALSLAETVSFKDTKSTILIQSTKSNGMITYLRFDCERV
ncbi:hypothetical protein LTR53_000721 [Teratosphaeriaceae sp. CCFEE 6253]|nr:hypothetical protein LTR53_000721 [Teratosphaeriaceae sp. CCFEE 6253]